MERARAKSREKKLRKLAKSKQAYTIKVNKDFKDLPRSFRGDCSPEDLCRIINEQAGRGHPLKDVKNDMIVGHLIRAFVTDAKEVWARVVPLEEPKPLTGLGDIW